MPRYAVHDFVVRDREGQQLAYVQFRQSARSGQARSPATKPDASLLISPSCRSY